ncbi:MAG: hypothetical protein LUC88_09595 [Prevotella sp.]|nr:hypothetical protein [Prevotella sp.]
MTGDFAYYIYCLIGLIVAIFVFKKVAGCLIRTIIFAIILAVLVAIYYYFFKQ